MIRRRLKEPERWQAVAHEGGTDEATRLLRPVIRRSALAQERARRLVLWRSPAWSGYGGSASLLRPGALGLHAAFSRQGLSPQEVEAKLFLWTGINSVMQNLGGFFGIYVFSIVTHWIGRRSSFAISFVAALVSTAFFFWYVGRSERHVLDDAVDGLLPIGAVRRIRDLLSRSCFPHGCAAPACRSATTSAALSPRSAPSCWPSLPTTFSRSARLRTRADALRRRGDVRRVPDRAGRTSLRPRNQRPTAAGMKAERRGQNDEWGAHPSFCNLTSAFPPCLGDSVVKTSSGR